MKILSKVVSSLSCCDVKGKIVQHDFFMAAPLISRREFRNALRVALRNPTSGPLLKPHLTAPNRILVEGACIDTAPDALTGSSCQYDFAL